MSKIIVVNMLNEEINKSDYVAYDIDEKKFIFGSYSDHYVYDGELKKNIYDFTDDQDREIRKAYEMGLSASGNCYIVYDDRPKKLYYIPANNPQPPILLFDADKPEEINEDFIQYFEEPIDQEALDELRTI